MNGESRKVWSKSDEVNELRKLVRKWGDRPETYLADLFTQRLLDWFTLQVKRDLPADLLAERNHLEVMLSNVESDMEQAVARERRQLFPLEAKLTLTSNELRAVQHELEQVEAREQQLARELNKAQAQIRALKALYWTLLMHNDNEVPSVPR